MFKMVDGTGIIGVDMICPLGVSTPQPPNYDRVELEGVGMLVLPNSLDAPLERLELGGKTEQLNTRGVNLWRSDSTVIVSGTKYLMFDNPIQTGTYTLSAIFANDKSASESLFAFYNEQNQNVGGGTIKQGGRQSKTFTLTGKAVKVLFYASSGHDSSQGVTTTIKEMQLETGTTATTYEPYTGGKPSPSPEYPQEIVNAGRLNEDTGKYEVEVTINSNNLFKVTEHTTGYYVDKDGKVQINKTLGYSWAADVNNLQKQSVTLHVTTMINIKYRLYCTDLQNTILYKYTDSSTNANDNSHTFNMPDGAKKIYVSVIEINSVEQAEITLNLGSVTLPYEPYKEQTLTLTSDRPITKWDRLVEQGGQIGWLYSTGVYEDIKESDISANSMNDQYGRYYVNAIKAYKNAECMCNIAEYSPAQKENKCGFWWSDTLCFLISSEYTGNNGTEDNSTAIKNFKDNVLSKGITVFYKLNTEEFIPLPQSEQNAIRALKTYYPTTVITADGGELDPDIKVTYRKEI